MNNSFFVILCLSFAFGYMAAGEFTDTHMTGWQPRQRSNYNFYAPIPAMCIARHEIEMDNCFCETVYVKQPVNLIYYDKWTPSNNIVLAWALLEKHMPAIQEGKVDSYQEGRYGIKAIQSPDSAGKCRVCYYSTRALQGAYSFNDNPLGMSVYVSDTHNVIVQPNMPFRAFGQMAEGITFPEVKAFCTIGDSDRRMPALGFDFGRIQVFLEAVKDRRLDYHINNTYKGYVDTDEGLVHRTEFVEEFIEE